MGAKTKGMAGEAETVAARVRLGGVLSSERARARRMCVCICGDVCKGGGETDVVVVVTMFRGVDGGARSEQRRTDGWGEARLGVCVVERTVPRGAFEYAGAGGRARLRVCGLPCWIV